MLSMSCPCSYYVLGILEYALVDRSFEEHGCWKAETEVRRSVAKLALGKHGIWSSARGLGRAFSAYTLR